MSKKKPAPPEKKYIAAALGAAVCDANPLFATDDLDEAKAVAKRYSEGSSAHAAHVVGDFVNGIYGYPGRCTALHTFRNGVNYDDLAEKENEDHG